MVVGVGFLLFSIIDNVPKLFVVKELKNKPEIHKKAGMLSFPLETFKETDKTYTGTINRLVEEEIGIPLNNVLVVAMIPKNFHLIPGRKDIATVYGFGFFANESRQEFTPTDNDIAFAGWLTCDELLAYPSIRVETTPILRHFLKNHAREILG